jgi:hypothetical protein
MDADSQLHRLRVARARLRHRAPTGSTDRQGFALGTNTGRRVRPVPDTRRHLRHQLEWQLPSWRSAQQQPVGNDPRHRRSRRLRLGDRRLLRIGPALRRRSQLEGLGALLRHHGCGGADGLDCLRRAGRPRLRRRPTRGAERPIPAPLAHRRLRLVMLLALRLMRERPPAAAATAARPRGEIKRRKERTT